MAPASPAPNTPAELPADLAAALQAFADSEERTGSVACPKTLTPAERHAVHVFCEAHSLSSSSSGRDAERFVTVTDGPRFDGRAWAQQTLAALAVEQRSETDELEATLKTLSAAASRRGVSAAHGGPIPAHKLGARSEVRLRAKKNKVPAAGRRLDGDGDDVSEVSGVVSKATDASIEFLTDAAPEAVESLRGSLRLGAVATDATTSRARRATSPPPRRTRPRRTARGPCGTRSSAAAAPPALLQPSSAPHLDDHQRACVARAEAEPALFLVHGPPGTGKTTTVVEVIARAAAKGQRVLACAASNVAVDNLLERVAAAFRAAKSPRGLLRLGHPARLSEAASRYSMEEVLRTADGADVLEDARAELRNLRKDAAADRASAKRTAARRETRVVRAELRDREKKLAKDVVKRCAVVVFATNVGAASRLLDDAPPFDLVVVDECAQALEISCWIPLLRGKRAVLAGDHRQLAPTVKCDDGDPTNAPAALLKATLFERLMDDRRPGRGEAHISLLLATQYRMHGDISEWASAATYDGRLRAAPSCVARDLYAGSFLPPPVNPDDAIRPMVHVDTAGLGFFDDSDAKTRDDADEHGAASVANPSEAAVVASHVALLLAAGLDAAQICVIAPYNAQVAALRGALEGTGVEARTVDGYQGGERDAVVLSLTRSNEARAVGFLADERRLNVAVTRARRHVAVVCDADTVRSSPFIAALLDHVADAGDYVSASAYEDGAPAPTPLEPSTTTATTAPAEKRAAFVVSNKGDTVSLSFRELDALETATCDRGSGPTIGDVIALAAQHGGFDGAARAVFYAGKDVVLEDLDISGAVLVVRRPDGAVVPDDEGPYLVALGARCERCGRLALKEAKEEAKTEKASPASSSPPTASEEKARTSSACLSLRVVFAGATYDVPFSRAFSVGELKAAIASATGVDAERQKLVCRGSFGDAAAPLSAAAPALVDGAKVVLLEAPRAEDVPEPPKPRTGKHAAKKAKKKARAEALAAAEAAAPAAPPPAPAPKPPPAPETNSLLKQLARSARRAAAEAEARAAMKANAKAKKAEPDWKRWVDTDGNIRGNDAHSRQAERDRAALLEKARKAKEDKGRKGKKLTKAQQADAK
ncbi:ATP-dependent 5'-3' RNA helicase [Aureococcus anophagefferens]|nr:ATP-dependent 5'-3' RNA helicase [Aureococcus anophagefferens]